MNRLGCQQKALMRGCVVDGIVCPNPRRIGVPLQVQEALRHSPRLICLNQQTDACDAKAGTEILDIIRTKSSYNPERSDFQVASPSSPPFFTGTPPSRVSNPLVQDEKFGNVPFSSMHETSSVLKPDVRIEGFQCSGNGQSPSPRYDTS